jgi:hypothetical protein
MVTNQKNLSNLFSTFHLSFENSNIFKFIFKLQGQVAKELKRSNVTLRNQTLSPDLLFRENLFFAISNSHLSRQVFYHLKTNEIFKMRSKLQIKNPPVFESNLYFEYVSMLLQKFKINNVAFASSFQYKKKSNLISLNILNYPFFKT